VDVAEPADRRGVVVVSPVSADLTPERREQLLAALSISGPIDRMTRHPGDRHGAAVATAAGEAARVLAPG